MSNNTNKPGCTISLSGLNLFTLAFVILKLCKVISWSWWWVLAPTWIPLGIGLIAFIIWLGFVVFTDKHYY